MPYCFGRRLRHAPPLSARALPRAAGARVLGIPLLGKDVRDPLPSHPPTQDDISKRIEDAISEAEDVCSTEDTVSPHPSPRPPPRPAAPCARPPPPPRDWRPSLTPPPNPRDPQAGCAVAWDNVEELSAEKKHEAQKNPEITDPLEKFCSDEPDADECRVHDN